MENNGYVKLFRSILDRERWDDQPTFRIFLYLLLRANHKEASRKGHIIKQGELISSYEKISLGTGLSIQSVRTALKKLKTTGEITYKSTNKNTQISLINWGKYQSDNIPINKQSNKQLTNEQQTNNKPLTTNKNEKKNKEGKEEKEVIDLTKYFSQMFFSTEQEFNKLKIDFGERNVDKMLESYDAYIINNKNGKNYKSPYLAVRNWLTRDAEQGKIKLPMKSSEKKDMSFDEWEKEQQKSKADKNFYKSLVNLGQQ